MSGAEESGGGERICDSGAYWHLADTEASCGEEIAQAPGLISLSFDEKNLSLEMVGVFQGGGEGFILLSIVFEAQGFCLQGAIEARVIW